MLKNRPRTCDNFGNPYISCDKFWSISSTDKLWFSERAKKNAIHWYKSYLCIYGGYVELQNDNQAQVWANLEANN